MPIVCVLDRGCDMDHASLAPFAAPGITITPTGESGTGAPIPDSQGKPIRHGTLCAGIIAHTYISAFTSGPLGFVGVPRTLRIMPVAIQDDTGPNSGSEIARGINWATNHGAHIISMSLTFSPTNFLPADAALINIAIQNAINSNVVMCVATGDGGHDKIDYPANQPRVLAVGACDPAGQRVRSASIPTGGTWGSNFGPEISVVALGINVDTSYLGAGYVSSFLGTSAAAPQVSALAALILSAYPSLSNTIVRALIERNADHPSGGRNNEIGDGRIIEMNPFDSFIGGHVLSESSGPLPFATVTVNGISLSATTDNSGRFSLILVPPGPQTLTVSAPGFVTEILGVEIPAHGDVLVGTIALVPDYNGTYVGLETHINDQRQFEIKIIIQQTERSAFVLIFAQVGGGIPDGIPTEPQESGPVPVRGPTLFCTTIGSRFGQPFSHNLWTYNLLDPNTLHFTHHEKFLETGETLPDSEGFLRRR